MGVVVGLWGVLPKYVSPPLNTADRVEFADHVVPGVAVILLSAIALLWWKDRSPLASLGLGLAVLLAGFWMLATHLPLVAQATRGEAPWPGTIYHTASTLAVFGLGLLWCASYWRDVGASEVGAAESGSRSD